MSQIGKSQNQYHYEKKHTKKNRCFPENISPSHTPFSGVQIFLQHLWNIIRFQIFLFQISHTHTDNIISLKLIIALLTGCYMFQKLFQFPPVLCMIDICLYFCQCFFTFHIDSSLCADSFPDNPELASSYHETGKN